MLTKYISNQKLLYFIGGIATAVIGAKAIKSNKTRSLCVKGLAKGMKLQKDAQEVFQNMKEEAADICFDAEQQNNSAQ